jgi:glycosyltransferase involved in cell wall biosynthesis
MTAGDLAAPVRPWHRLGRPATASSGSPRRLRVLHLVLVLGETNSQYNEHCLPQLEARELAICTYFPPRLTPPAAIALFPGDGTLPGFFRALRAALAAHDYDVVHAHSPHTSVLLPLGVALHPRSWRAWRSMVLTVHDSFYDYKPRNQLLTVAGLALFPRVVFCSRSAWQSLPAPFRTLTAGRARVVQNGADLERVTRIARGVDHPTDGMFRVVSVGRLEPVKDPLGLLRAFAAGTDGHCRLQLIGDGSLAEQVEHALVEGGLEDRVEATGLVPRDDVFRAYARSDLFVSASHGEGLPIAVLEAMAAGLPVVLSDIPPHREVVDGLTCVPLVAPGDVAGFGREIERFREMSPSDRREVGRRCRDWVLERFTLERMHDGYDAVYREVLREEPA